MRLSRDVGVMMAMLTTGCFMGPRGMIARSVPPATDQFARAFIDTLQRQPARVALKFFVPQMAMNDAVADSIATIQRLVPQGQPDSLQIVGVDVRDSYSGPAQRSIIYQLHASGTWVLIQLILWEDEDGRPELVGLHAWPEPSSLQSRTALTLQHASPGGLIAALLAIVVLGISAYAAVQVVRSPLERRWLWVIVAFIGFGKFGIEWGTGKVAQQWMAIQLFGAGIVRHGLYGPWWIYLSMPGGAFLALDRRRRSLVGETEARAPVDGDSTPAREPTEAPDRPPGATP
jgi:hypothetical protein